MAQRRFRAEGSGKTITDRVAEASLELAIRGLHENLGHLSQDQMLRVPRHGCASPAARRLACDVSQQAGRPTASQPAAITHDAPPLHAVALYANALPGCVGGPVGVSSLSKVDLGFELHRIASFFEAESTS